MRVSWKLISKGKIFHHFSSSPAFSGSKNSRWYDSYLWWSQILLVNSWKCIVAVTFDSGHLSTIILVYGSTSNYQLRENSLNNDETTNMLCSWWWCSKSWPVFQVNVLNEHSLIKSSMMSSLSSKHLSGLRSKNLFFPGKTTQERSLLSWESLPELSPVNFKKIQELAGRSSTNAKRLQW